MGYYTRFTASVHGPKPIYDKFVEDSKSEKTFSDYALELDFWLGMSNNYDELKWYNWQRDCENLSKDYPNLLFVLEGEGEENDDMWKAWFRNGKSVVVRAKIVFEEPDLNEVLPLDHDAAAKLASKVAEEAEERARKAKEEAIAAAQEAYRAHLRAGANLEAARAQVATFDLTPDERDELFVDTLSETELTMLNMK